MEEGLNSESDLKNSETDTGKTKHEDVPFSDSKPVKNDIRIATKNQSNIPDNKEKNGNRNIIRFEPEEEKEELSKSEKDLDKKPESEEKASYQDEKNLSRLVKKNDSLIKELEKKVASLSEDVDDLISLYEIVSIEMNPFVGLSKITRNRLDALANIDKEFESLKARLEELEASIASGVVNQKNNYVNEGFNLAINIDDVIEDALDYIVEKSRIDGIIDEFIEDLQTGNVAI